MPNEERFHVPVAEAREAFASEFSEVYRRYYRDVFRYVLALTRSSEEAEEVTADTFERALRRWSAIPTPTLPWLLLTARRRATDRWRRAQRRLRAVASTNRHPASGRSDTVEFWVWFDAVTRALTDRQREVLILRYQRDLNDGEIGRIMGITESGVRSLLGRALRVLRAHPELLL